MNQDFYLHRHFQEHETVRTVRELSDGSYIIPAGEIGTIIHVYGGGDCYEVEFSDPFIAVVTCHLEDIEEPPPLTT